jgi:hypothetical protein
MRQRLEKIYPKGTGRRGAAPRDGGPAPLIKGLFVNGKEAVDDMWEERGYDDMQPDEIRDRLRYRLDHEEATGCVVTSARNHPLLIGLEACNIGKRIIASVIPSGTIGKKLKEFKKRGTSPAAYLQESVKLNLDPPKNRPPPLRLLHLHLLCLLAPRRRRRRRRSHRQWNRRRCRHQPCHSTVLTTARCTITRAAGGKVSRRSFDGTRTSSATVARRISTGSTGIQRSRRACRPTSAQRTSSHRSSVRKLCVPQRASRDLCRASTTTRNQLTS